MNLQTAKWLGYAGLIPFFAAAIGHSAGLPTRPLGLAYAAVILSFLGGIQWGTALLAPVDYGARSRRFVASVMPSLMAWVALILPSPFAQALLLGGFGGQWLYDQKHALESNWPPGFVELRTHLTLGAILAVALMWI